MLLTSCGGLTVATSTATMLRSVRHAHQVDALARAESPPHDGEQTPGAHEGSNTSMSKQMIDRPLADLVAELGHALGEAAAHQLVERHDLVAEAMARGTTPCA